jgi:hypothetical protein
MNERNVRVVGCACIDPDCPVHRGTVCPQDASGDAAGPDDPALGNLCPDCAAEVAP